MLIYVGGDSFASGDELCDPELDVWPGTIMNDGQHTHTTQWMSGPVRLPAIVKRWGDYGVYLEHCKKRAWPSLLAHLGQVEVVNSSQSGNSMLGILSRTQRDLVALKREGRVPDKVFIQVTGMLRTSLFNVKKIIKVVNLSPFYGLETQASGDADYVKAWARAEHEESMAYRWILMALAIRDTVMAMTGKPPIWLDSVFITGYSGDLFEGLIKSNAVKPLWEDLGGLKMIKPGDSMLHHHDDKTEPRMPGYHLTQVVHDRYARELTKYL